MNPGFSHSCPRKVLAPVSSGTPTTISQCSSSEDNLSNQGDRCPGVWATLWDAEVEHLGIAQDIIGCLIEEPKVEKGRDLGDLGTNKHGKIEE